MLVGDNERAEADYTNIFQGYLPHVHLGLMLRDYWSFSLECPPYFSSPNIYICWGWIAYLLHSHEIDFVTIRSTFLHTKLYYFNI